MNEFILFILKIGRLVLEKDIIFKYFGVLKEGWVFFCSVEQMSRNRFKLRQRKLRFDIRKNLSW